ncbi:MAG: hypothetical protein ABGZ49_02235 [Akkermansiaceae bacterium]
MSNDRFLREGERFFGAFLSRPALRRALTGRVFDLTNGGPELASDTLALLGLGLFLRHRR